MRRLSAAALIAALAITASAAATPQETPYLAKLVASGKLPPVEQRLPQEPAVANPPSLGKPGGRSMIT